MNGFKVRVDDIGKAQGRALWGAMPLPQNAQLHGMVTRETGETGALLFFSRLGGGWAQGNAGALRGLPQSSVMWALEAERLQGRADDETP